MLLSIASCKKNLPQGGEDKVCIVWGKNFILFCHTAHFQQPLPLSGSLYYLSNKEKDRLSLRDLHLDILGVQMFLNTQPRLSWPSQKYESNVCMTGWGQNYLSNYTKRVCLENWISTLNGHWTWHVSELCFRSYPDQPQIWRHRKHLPNLPTRQSLERRI